MANHKPTNGYKKDGTPNNPTGKGGFGDHPENRNPGGWRPEYTPSYQYRRFMNMDSDELIELAKKWKIISPTKEEIESGEARKKYRGKFPHTTVEEMALRRILASMKSLADIKEITDRVEGRAVQKVEAKVENTLADYTDEDLAKLEAEYD